jgi:S1-C subfamily serine protease
LRLGPPDWLIYLGLVGLILGVALLTRERIGAPAAPPPVPGEAQMPLAADSPFTGAGIVHAPASAVRAARTAFSAGLAGVWVTAGSALGHCRKPALVIADGRAIAARPVGPAGPVRVLTTGGAGVVGLPLTPAGEPRRGELGFEVGFPEGAPGEVAARLVGTAPWPSSWRGTPALVWAEAGHTEGLAGARAGLVGAPVLDRAGQVVGVMLAYAPRRGRLYAAPPDALRQALAAAHASPDPSAPGQPIAADSYGRAADDLRRDARVVPLICL